MLKVEQHNHDNGGDPQPSFATDAEIEIADQLRHQLEERYLKPSTPDAPVPHRSDKDTDSIR